MVFKSFSCYILHLNKVYLNLKIMYNILIIINYKSYKLYFLLFTQEKRAKSVAQSLSQASAYINFNDIFKFRAVKNISKKDLSNLQSLGVIYFAYLLIYRYCVPGVLIEEFFFIPFFFYSYLNFELSYLIFQWTRIYFDIPNSSHIPIHIYAAGMDVFWYRPSYGYSTKFMGTKTTTTKN